MSEGNAFGVIELLVIGYWLLVIGYWLLVIGNCVLIFWSSFIRNFNLMASIYY